MNDQFVEQGYLGPIRVLTTEQCPKFLRALNKAHKQRPMIWSKGRAASFRVFYEIGTHPAIIEVVAELLGEDIMLYGANMKNRAPGAIHPWHSDIESSDPSSKTVSVWIGLKNTNSDSSLLIIPYSHNFGVTVQEYRYRYGKDRDKTTNEDVVSWARMHNKQSQLLRPDLTEGQALFFDGRLWHSSYNHSNGTRQAIFLQYATPDTEIRIPAEKYLNWPLHQLDSPKPPCIMIRGSDKFGVNQIVSAPKTDGAGSEAELTSRVYPLQIPVQLDERTDWKPYHIFRGSTTNIRNLNCHVSVLATEKSPHPPHRHKEEEILMLLSGEVDLLLPEDSTLKREKRRRLKPGQFVFYPNNFLHSLETVSMEPANYLMFKWYSNPLKNKSSLVFGQFDAFDSLADLGAGDGFRTNKIFRGPTDCLKKLGCHVSAVAPGAGYEPHVDAYEVAIIVLEGEVETLDERVGPHGIIFYAAGEPHGLRNPGKTTAKYLVFAFSGSKSSTSRTHRSLRSKLIDPKCWKRALKHHLKRFGKLVSLHIS